ncbi:MAG: hypothetical protein WD801_08645 [Gemmatimonadaceae bacterium]
MTTIRGVWIAALALVAGALPAAAQTAPVRGVSLWPGTEIRATMASPATGARQVRGRLVVLAGDTLRVTPRGTNTIATYQVASVERLEVRGRRQRKLGFALGAAVGAGITAAIAGPDWNRGGISRDQFAGLVATNALIGGCVGFAFGPREWTELPLRR